MWKAEVKVTTIVDKKKIWEIWTNVNQWNRWDIDVEYSEIIGNFVLGAKGVIKTKRTPKNKFTIVKCQEEECFVNRTLLPLCRIDFIHELKESEKGGILVIHRVEINGFLSPLFAKILGENINKNMQLAVNNLIEIAENE